jgi:hypothetical protein
MHVAWLRQELEKNPQDPKHIHTVRGVGCQESQESDLQRPAGLVARPTFRSTQRSTFNDRLRSSFSELWLTVSPGFIDIHNHSDSSIVQDGNAQSMIRQGVTSMILGEGT